MNDQINKFVAAYAKSQGISEQAAKEKIMLAGCGRINALRKYSNRLKKGEVHPPSLEKRKAQAKAKPAKKAAAKKAKPAKKAKAAGGGGEHRTVTQRAMARVAKAKANGHDTTPTTPEPEKMTGMSEI